MVKPASFQLPFMIILKVNSLVQRGNLVGPTLNSDFYDLIDTSKLPIEQIEVGLESLSQLKHPCFQPAEFLRGRYNTFQSLKQPLPISEAFPKNDSFASIWRVLVTPCKVYFCGPDVILSNRVLRNYPQDIENFLRVSFVDEDRKRIRSTDLIYKNNSKENDQKTDVYNRILSILRNGVRIGEKIF